MPQGLKIVCSIILQGSRLRRTGRTPNDTDAVKGLHTIFETGLKVFALDNLLYYIHFSGEVQANKKREDYAFHIIFSTSSNFFLNFFYEIQKYG